MESIVKTLTTVNIRYYFLALSLFLLTLPLKTIRWGIFLREKNVSVSQLKLLVLYFIGMFFNTFLPSIFAGDAIRTYYIYKEYHSDEIPATSVIIERFCGLFTLFVIGLSSSLFWIVKYGKTPFANSSFFVCFGAVSVLMLLLSRTFHNRLSQISRKLHLRSVGNVIHRVYHSICGYTENKKIIFCGLALSFLVSFFTISIGYLLSLALFWEIPFYIFLFTIPVITIATMIPVSFGGIGVRETAFFIVFSQYGITGSSAIALALLWYSINLLTGAFGGICYAFYMSKQPQ